MPDRDMFNIIKIACNPIDTHGNDSTNNCSTNTAICQRSKHVQHYINMMQDVHRAKKSCASKDTISKFGNKDKPAVSDKEPNTISYFLPGPNQDNDNRVSVE